MVVLLLVLLRPKDNKMEMSQKLLKQKIIAKQGEISELDTHIEDLYRRAGAYTGSRDVYAQNAMAEYNACLDSAITKKINLQSELKSLQIAQKIH
jgi:hypothetical protein